MKAYTDRMDAGNETGHDTHVESVSPGQEQQEALPFIARRFPADGITLGMMGALQWPDGRARFAELAIPREAIENDDARHLAAAMLAQRPFADPDVRAILERDDGRTVGWGDAIDLYDSYPDAGYAVRAVERFGAEVARHWLPATLEWLAGQLRAGRFTFRHVVHELTQIIGMARPALDREAA